MRNFLRLATNIDVQPLRLALFRQPDLWTAHSFRTAFPGSPHSSVEDILLRCQPLDASISDARESVNYPAFAALPEAYRLTMALMAQVQGERLGRVMLTRLQPGQEIAPHSDVGTTPYHYEQVRYWIRHHIVVESDESALFRCEQEVVHMAPGECWAFRNDLEHEVFWHGTGETERIHLIIDTHSANEPVGNEKTAPHHPHAIAGQLAQEWAGHYVQNLLPRVPSPAGKDVAQKARQGESAHADVSG